MRPSLTCSPTLHTNSAKTFSILLFVFSCFAMSAARAQTPLPNVAGDPVFIAPDEGTNLGPGNMVVTSGGVIFHAESVGTGLGGINPHTIIRRSTDHGVTWQTWGMLPQVAGERLLVTEMVLAEGAITRLHILYDVWFDSSDDGEVRHAWVDPNATIPVFSVNTVFQVVGSRFEGSDLASDVDEFGIYYLYAVAILHSVNSDGDLLFSRSTNQGDSWSVGMTLALGGRGGIPSATQARIAFGSGLVHVAYSLGDAGLPGAQDDALYYRQALNAGALLSDWQPAQLLRPLGNGEENRPLDIVASQTTGQVHLLYNADPSANLTGTLWTSSDGGTTWLTSDIHSFAPEVHMGRLARTANGDRIWITGSREGDGSFCGRQPVVVAATGSPLSLGAVEAFADPDSQKRVQAPALAPDPSVPGAFGLAWAASVYTCDVSAPWPVRFNATWFLDPGYPNLEDGFPVPLTAAPASPPALTQLDADIFDEIVFTDVSGNVHLLSHTGIEEAGWPKNIGPTVFGGAVAVGDLNGDGRNVIAAGTASGDIWVYDPFANAPSPGFPLNLSNSSMRVTIAPVAAPYPASIVATAGTQVFLVSYRGELRFSWELAAPVDHAATVGDVDGDGVPEIFVSTGGLLHRLKPFNPTPVWSVPVASFALGAPPTLADLDGDGKREIIVPTVTGTVSCLDGSGAIHWSHSMGTFDFTGQVAAADMAGLSDLELAATSTGIVHMIRADGSTQVGYPQYSSYGSGGFFADPVIGNIHWSSPDIVASTDQAEAFSWVNIGGVTPGWPRTTGAPAQFAPAIGDVDVDGKNEVVQLTTTSVLMFDVNNSPQLTPSRRWPMWGNDPGRSFCQGCQEEPLVTAADALPSTFSFAAPRPNPSTGVSMFRFDLPGESRVELSIYDARGRRVREVIARKMGSGTKIISFNGRDDRGHRLATGQYFARLDVMSGDRRWSRTQKLTLVH